MVNIASLKKKWHALDISIWTVWSKQVKGRKRKRHLQVTSPECGRNLIVVMPFDSRSCKIQVVGNKGNISGYMRMNNIARSSTSYLG